uniref:Uncharacterized protein n=1 Tax=Rhizophora mucronata TaxID=61149 RepID=A0A2P2IQ20_RHIMU
MMYNQLSKQTSLTSQEPDRLSRMKNISSSVNLKLAIKLMHSSKPAKIVYSPPKGFFRKYKSNTARS